MITWVACARIAQPIVEGLLLQSVAFLSSEVWLMLSADNRSPKGAAASNMESHYLACYL